MNKYCKLPVNCYRATVPDDGAQPLVYELHVYHRAETLSFSAECNISNPACTKMSMASQQ